MTTIAQWRFDETDDTLRPQDEIGNLGDLDVEAGLVMPDVIDGVLGRARIFVSSLALGFRAQDVVPGSTLLQRDMTIQVVLSWDIVAQNTYGSPGTIYCRGKGTAAPEYANAGLELRVVNLAANVGEIRWFWHDLAGALHTEIGGHFTLPDANSFTMLTVTRRWISTTNVVLRHYIGDQLISEIVTVDGSIGGGTTGTTSIGTRWTGAAWGNFLSGAIDEIRILDYEMSNEELAATWKRLTDTQPKGYKLLRELHPRGFPISDDPSSKVQLETNLWGQGLGFAAAQADNIRDNIMPDRAYGPILSRWEAICAVPPKPGDSIDTRRARVISHIRNKAGVSIPGLEIALKELIGTDPSNLQFLGFPPELGKAIGETYDKGELWLADPAASWTLGATARVQELSGTALLFNGATRNWRRLEASMPSSKLYTDGQGAHILSKVSPGTFPTNGESGVFFADYVHNDYLLLGIRNTAGVYQVAVEPFVGGVSGGVTIVGTTAQVPHWLHLFHQGGSANLYTVAYSLTSEIAGYTTLANIAWPAGFEWCGLYSRTFTGTIGANLDVTFDETRILCPFGERCFEFYVYRDPAVAGTIDVIGAHAVIQAVKQAHTIGTLITSKSLIADDSGSSFDRGPAGAL